MTVECIVINHHPSHCRFAEATRPAFQQTVPYKVLMRGGGGGQTFISFYYVIWGEGGGELPKY